MISGKASLFVPVLVVLGVVGGLLFFVFSPAKTSLRDGNTSLIGSENGNITRIECRDLITRVYSQLSGGNEKQALEAAVEGLEFNESQLEKNRGSKCEWFQDYGSDAKISRTIEFTGDEDETHAEFVLMKNTEKEDFEIVSETEDEYTGTTKRLIDPSGLNVPVIDKGNYARAVKVHGRCLLTYYLEQVELSGGISDSFENVEKNWLEASALTALTDLKSFTSDEVFSSFCGTDPGDKVVLPQ